MIIRARLVAKSISIQHSVARVKSVAAPCFATQRRLLVMSTTPLKIETHTQYESPSFGPSSVHPDPLVQFRDWFKTAQSPVNPEQGVSPITNPTLGPKSRVSEPEAMSLATSSVSGVPSNRMVLLKEIDEKGFVFFTNYTSRKSKELLENPHAALNFYWREIHQQVRIVGKVEKLEPELSDRYFNSRPLGSRVGAWGSPQSLVIGEDELANRVKQVEERFGIHGSEKKDITRPEFWGGWRVVPE
jgi:pyridoxamine-phosphate oxidase